jgi:metal-responsive CopG/Arc/MetJ family transcriptional regulator
MKKNDDNTVRFNLMVSAGWLEALDQWRIQQPGIPNRSEAIRRAVEKVTGKTAGGKK